MKKVRKLSSIAAALLLVLSSALSVYAEGTAAAAVLAPEIWAGASKAAAFCQITGAGDVTNGKLRITYDSSVLSLESAVKGSALSGAMVQINDPVNGNKPEGEIVLAFASAEAFAPEGSLLDMTFQNTGLQPGDSTDIEVKVEELASDGAVVETENGTGTIYMKEEADTLPPDEPGGNPGEDPGDDDNNNPPDNPQGGEQTDKPSKPDKEPPKTVKNTSNTAKNTAGAEKKSTTTAENAKTDDETNLFLPMAVGIGALLVIFSGVRFKREKR